MIGCYQLKVRAATASVLIFLAYSGIANASEDVNVSTEYTSPLGSFGVLGVAKTLAVGIQVIEGTPGVPSTSGQGSFTINGNMTIDTGNVNVEEILNVDNGTLKTYAGPDWGGTHWLGIDVDPATLVGGKPRNEFQVGGNIAAKRFRASPNVPWWQSAHYDEVLLYFGVTADGAWVEMGSKAGDPHNALTPGYGDPESAARFTASPKIVLNYYSTSTDPALRLTTGNVGIGTETPTYKLQIGAPGSGLTAIAHSWEEFSSREYKTDITPLTPGQYRDLSSRLDAVTPVYFHYKQDSSYAPLRLGIIAENTPAELLNADKKAMSTMGSAVFVISVIKDLRDRQGELEKQVVALEREVAKLEKARVSQ